MNEVYVYQWVSDENDVRAYCLSRSRQNVCLRIQNFTPYVYLEVKNECAMKFVRAEVSKFALRTDIVRKRSLYNDGKEFKPYLFCQCASRKKIVDLAWFVKKYKNVIVHEMCASDVLQLVSLRNLPMTGWIRYAGTAVPDEERTTSCDEEYVVRWKSLSPSDSDDVVAPKMLAFDFEVNSEIANAMPDDRPDDAIFQISCVVQEEGKPTRSVLLTLDGEDLNSEQLDGIEVIAYTCEESLIVGFLNVLDGEKPNVVTGYNILGFDINYLVARCERYMLTNDLCRCGFNKVDPARLREIKWDSSAFSDQRYSYVDWEGVLILDLYPIIKRDYKLSNYKLHTVANAFLSETKDPVTVKQIFEAYRTRRLATVGKYCVQDSKLCIGLANFANYWIALGQMSRICNVGMFTLYTQGQQIKIYSQVYKHCLGENIVVNSEGCETKANERYIGAYVFDPVPGYYEKVVPLDFSSLYPSIIISYNICYSTICGDDVNDDRCHVFEWEDHVGCEHDEKIVEIARLTKAVRDIDDLIEIETKRKAKLTGSKNARERIKVQKYVNALRLRQRPYRRARQEIKTSVKEDSDIICAKRRYKFLKAEHKKGVVPTIIKNLLESRKSVRSEMAKCVDDAQRIVLEKRQLAYKVSANSMYGAMGVNKGYLPFMPGAMCVTYMGRISIAKAAKLVETEWKGKLIYGDTDSNYVVFPHLTDARATWDYAELVAKSISEKFPEAMNLEFEKTVYERFLIFRKKRYVYQEVDKNGALNPKIGYKGVVLARRDNSPYMKTAYENVIRMIFDKRPATVVIDYVVEYVKDTFRNVIAYDDYVVTSSVGNADGDVTEEGRLGRYKVRKVLPEDEAERNKLLNGRSERDYYVSCLPAQMQLAERMKNRGCPMAAGSRVEYVVLKTDPRERKLANKLEDYDYFKARSRYLTVDKLYYLKSLINPLDQVLSVGIGMDDFVKNMHAYRFTYDKVLNQLGTMFYPRMTKAVR